ncbi:hypothetical protein L6164_028158 [Bauhinia variegata]|uniref:Uncharacterized protein n=1 Tax=Bauhinia variegata TaxID=167791 RepID=A0ACB9LVL4_BAUVA|nr:hypothetical protein L6164_028158 [Bauhinia variegata]
MVDPQDTDSVARNDMLDALLHISKENSQDMDKATFGCGMDLFAAGTDTTSSTVEWATAEPLHSPDGGYVKSKTRGGWNHWKRPPCGGIRTFLEAGIK